MSTLETLIAARKLITPESAWACGRDSFDGGGRYVIPVSPLAVKWCAGGAILKVMGRATHNQDSDFPVAWEFLADSLDIERLELGEWNDTHTHEEVLAAFDAAIEKARA